ncbi:MAG: VCBS repeat-containing protein [Planctomycetota bacterium]|nr:VCBS repeat-containing protein [Planctomycetota bacterium]
MSPISTPPRIFTVAAVTLLSNIAAAQFLAPQTIASTFAADVDTADLDNDGDADWVVAGGATGFSWIRNNSGNFVLLTQIEAENATTIAGPTVMASTDPQDPTGQEVLFNGPGQYTIYGPQSFPHAAGTTDYIVEVRYKSNLGAQVKFEETGGGPGSLYEQMVFPATNGAWSNETFIITLPNSINLALAYDAAASTGAVRINWMRISERATTVAVPGGGQVVGASEIHAVDIDSDGDVDVLMGARGQSGLFIPGYPGENAALRIYRNNGSAGFAATDILYSGAFGSGSTGAKGCNGLTTADIDGDGDLDIVMSQELSNPGGTITVAARFVWFENDRTSDFGAGRPSDPGGLPRAVDAADADGDGDVDVLASYNGAVVVWSNPGNGVGSWGYNPIAFKGAGYSLFRDLNGDQVVDVLCAHSGEVSYYAGSGAGGFGAEQVISAGAADAVHTNDVDGDGDLDILASSSTSLRFCEALGGGAFAPSLAVATGLSPTGAEPFSVDVDGDGNTDVGCGTATGVRYWRTIFGAVVASKSTFGASCASQASSFYEVLNPQAMDLSGQRISAVRTSSGWSVSRLPGTVIPVGAGATQLNMLTNNIPYNMYLGGPPCFVPGGSAISCWPIRIGADGVIEIYNPTLPTTPFLPFNPPYQASDLLANSRQAVYAWTDLQIAAAGGGGSVYLEEFNGPSSGTIRVTYLNVAGQGAAGGNTFQITLGVSGSNWLFNPNAFSLNSFSITFGALSANNPEPWVVGYSPAGPRDDPGPTDLSSIGINTLSLSDNDVVIALDSNAPQLGSSWNLALSDYGSFPFGFLLFGDTKYNPGISLAGLGAPGCSAYTNGNLSAQLVPLAGGAATVPIPIPNNSSLSGAKLACQATAPSGINTFGIATSNGLDVTVGL